MNSNSVLREGVSMPPTLSGVGDAVPLLGHHQNTLHYQTLRKLGTDTLEQAHWTLVLNNVGHDLDERLEWLALTCWRWPRLQADFGDDQGLCRNRGERF